MMMHVDSNVDAGSFWIRILDSFRVEAPALLVGRIGGRIGLIISDWARADLGRIGASAAVILNPIINKCSFDFDNSV